MMIGLSSMHYNKAVTHDCCVLFGYYKECCKLFPKTAKGISFNVIATELVCNHVCQVHGEDLGGLMGWGKEGGTFLDSMCFVWCVVTNGHVTPGKELVMDL